LEQEEKVPNYTSTPGIALSPFYVLKRDVAKELYVGDLGSFMTNYDFAAWARVIDVTDQEYTFCLDTTDYNMYVQDTEVLEIIEKYEAESRPKKVTKTEKDNILEDGKIKRFYINLGGKEYYIDLDEWELFQKWKEKYEN
jgi:hypothetical protein